MHVGDRYNGIVLMGVPGSGKTYLGKLLHERRIGSYRELEPLLREKFGTGAEFNARIQEVGTFVWRSYQEQLDQDGPIPVFESAGVDDRPLMDLLKKQYSIAFIHVDVPRELCVNRVVSRPVGNNIYHTTDKERVGRYYDLWHANVLPMYDFALTVDGNNADAACNAIRKLLDTSR